MKTFVTSDLHFGHKNICGSEGFEEGRKQFETVQEMDEYLIEVHNKVVGYDDLVINHGDFSMYSRKKSQIVEKIKRMNGRLKIVCGNHDSQTTWQKVTKEFENDFVNGEPKLEVVPVGFITKIDGYRFYHSHFPMEIGLRRKIFNISGHIHSNLSRMENQINVGIDSDFAAKHAEIFGEPILLDVVIEAAKEIEENLEQQGKYNLR